MNVSQLIAYILSSSGKKALANMSFCPHSIAKLRRDFEEAEYNIDWNPACEDMLTVPRLSAAGAIDDQALVELQYAWDQCVQYWGSDVRDKCANLIRHAMRLAPLPFKDFFLMEQFSTALTESDRQLKQKAHAWRALLPLTGLADLEDVLWPSVVQAMGAVGAVCLAPSDDEASLAEVVMRCSISILLRGERAPSLAQAMSELRRAVLNAMMDRVVGFHLENIKVRLWRPQGRLMQLRVEGADTGNA